MAERPGSSVHDWRGPVRADYLAVPMTTGVQRPHRTLLRPAGTFVVTRQPVRVVAPALRHAKGLAPAGRIAVKVSSAQHIGKPVNDLPTDEVLGDSDAPVTGSTVLPSRPVPISDDEESVSGDDAPTTSGTITPTRSSAAMSPASARTSARPLPRPSTSHPPRRQVSTSPVPLPPQGMSPARTVRKPEDQVPPSRGDEPGESGVLPSEPLSDVLAAITVTEDGRTLTGRTRSMRRRGTRPQAQSSEHSSEATPPPTPAPSATSSSDTRLAPTRAHEHTRMSSKTSNHVDAVNPPEPVDVSPTSPPPGSSPASSSVPAVQSDGIQRRPHSTRMRGSAPAAATAATAHTPPVQADDSPQPSAENSPADTSATITPPPSTQGAPVTTSPESQPSPVNAASPSTPPPSNPSPSTPLSGTSHQASAPVLSDAPLQRRATTTPRADDASERNDTLNPHGSSETSPGTASAAPSASSSPSESEQSQSDQPNSASPGSPTTITVPADIRAAVEATTGVSPATASVVRGEAVSKRARDLQADAFTHRGHVHLPGTAPLTSDHQRRLLAHELTHVVQQESGRPLPPEHTPEGQRLEQKALDVEDMLATASSNSAPSPNVSTAALPTPAGTPAMTPPATGLAFAPAPTPPGERALAARVTRGDAPTKRTPVPGTRVDASSSSDLVRVAAVPGSPRPAGRSQPSSGPAAAATPVGQSAPPQASLAQASGLQPVALPVVTSQNPTTSSESLMASSEPDRSVVQRRRAQAAPSSAPVPPATPPSSLPAADPGGLAGQESSGNRRSPTERDNSTPDDAWLERHAAALYPIIRRHLRNELLRDRERRGRLVRED